MPYIYDLFVITLFFIVSAVVIGIALHGKKQSEKMIEIKIKEWEKCFQERLSSNHSIVKRFTEERLKEFKEEITPKSRSKTASQKSKDFVPLKIKKIH